MIQAIFLRDFHSSIYARISHGSFFCKKVLQLRAKVRLYDTYNPRNKCYIVSRNIYMIRYYTITTLERDQYEVLWSRVQQYWTRRNRVQYCCTLLHKTSYWSSASVVIVLLHKALFYSILKLFENCIILNFLEILWNFWKFWNFMKILNFLKKVKY